MGFDDILVHEKGKGKRSAELKTVEIIHLSSGYDNDNNSSDKALYLKSKKTHTKGFNGMLNGQM